MQGPKDALVHRCSYCGQSGLNVERNRCSGCKGATYCCEQHQRADWKNHKLRCKTIQKGLEKLQVEERKIQNNPADTFWPGNLFETSAGHFWGIIDTRDYMRARHHVAWELQHLNVREAVKTSLGHFRDMLRLNRSDNMGVRNVVPGLYLRLKKDQEAYDFLKWYATTGSRSNYDWGNLRNPYLNLKDEDVMEDLGFFKERYDINSIVAMCLIKLRMLLDLQDVQNGTCNPSNQLSLRSGIWMKRPELLEENGREQRITKLQSDVDTLFNRVKKENEHFWVSLLNHSNNMFAKVEYYSHGNAEEAIMAVQSGGRPWIETEGALEWVWERVEGE